MSEIKNKIIKQELIDWRGLVWLQTDSLKEISTESMDKLKKSISNNGFIQPFNVWQESKKKIWILDGVHRQRAMELLIKDGVNIPAKLPANFIGCADKKEAAKMVLLYTSYYAKMTEYGLMEFMQINELMLDEINSEADLADIDLDLLLPADIEESKNLNMEEEIKGLSNVAMTLGEYRFMVDRDKYIKFIDDIKSVVGFDKASVINEIKRRLEI
jgi:hypothetical protein